MCEEESIGLICLDSQAIHGCRGRILGIRSMILLRLCCWRSDNFPRARISFFFYPKASISPLLNQCTEEGQIVSKPQLQSLVRIMKEFRRFHHAQEMSPCMTDC